jgi:uncharacterized protein YbjT (DUF2867 family)
MSALALTRPAFLVTGATGKTGGATAAALLARGERVRALVHRADGRSERLCQAGCELVVGSLEDFDDLTAALDGVQRAYYCPPLLPGALRKTALFAEAARAARLEVVVALSQWLVDPTHRALHSREKWLGEQLLARAGFGVVTINPGFFADNYMAALEPMAQLGVMAMPFGDGRNAPPSNEDIARVIVAALVDPAPHVGQRYRPTGPRLLAPDEMAGIFAKVLDRPVHYRDAPLPLFLKVARSLGVTDYVLVQLHAFLEDYRRGSFAVGAPTDVVRAVGGAPPEDFETIARRYVRASSRARPSLGGKLRAIARLVGAMMTRAPDLDAIAARLDLPVPRSARLAADSARWRAAHDPDDRAVAVELKRFGA